MIIGISIIIIIIIIIYLNSGIYSTNNSETNIRETFKKYT